MKKLFLCLALLSFTAFADDHGMTDMKGPGIELKSYDHAFAGSVNGFLVFGNVDEGKGHSALTIKKDGGLSVADFNFGENRSFGGTLSHTDESGKQTIVNVEMVKLDRSNTTFTFKVNGQDLDVKIVADDFRNNHFINPEYKTTIGGKPFVFKMMSGHACYTMSAHLIAMMLAAGSL